MPNQKLLFLNPPGCSVGHLRYVKDETRSFSEPSQEQSRPNGFDESKSFMTLTKLVVTGILSIFILVLEGKADKEKPESSRIELLKKFSTNYFTLSDAKNKTDGLLFS